jgi:hypothetical protein
VNLENSQLKLDLKESQAMSKTLLKYLESIKNLGQHFQNQLNKENKKNKKMGEKMSKTSLDKSSFVNMSLGEYSDFQSDAPSQDSAMDMLPTFARCLFVDLEKLTEFKKVRQPDWLAKKHEIPSVFAKKSHNKATSFSMYKNNTVKKQKLYNFGEGKSKESRNIYLVKEESNSLSGSMVIDDGPVEKGLIPKMMIVSDMMDKSHCKGPMHLIFDLM